MTFNRVPTDFYSDLPMEVQPAFYPPPTVCVPQIEIPSLRKYEYKFEPEKTAILRWENEKKRLERNGEKTEKIQQNKTQRQRRHTGEEGRMDKGTDEGHFSLSEKGDKEQRGTEGCEDPPTNELQRSLRERLNVHSNTLSTLSETSANHLSSLSSSSSLPPIPMSMNSVNNSHFGTANNQNGIILQKSCSANNQLNGLEEFEPRRDLFDLMELRSLDARKELEKFFDL